MYGGGICMAYTTYIQSWISKLSFHVFMRNSMLHTNLNDIVEENIMLKPEMYYSPSNCVPNIPGIYMTYTMCMHGIKVTYTTSFSDPLVLQGSSSSSKEQSILDALEIHVCCMDFQDNY
jgi:hypothetical protein